MAEPAKKTETTPAVEELQKSLQEAKAQIGAKPDSARVYNTLKEFPFYLISHIFHHFL